MSSPDRDGTWKPRPAMRAEDNHPQQTGDDPLPAPPPIALPDQPAAEPPAQVMGRATVAPAGASPVEARPVRPGPAGPGPAEARPAQAGAKATAGPVARRSAAPLVTSAPLATSGADSGALSGFEALRLGDQDQPPTAGGAESDALARTGPSGRMARLHLGRHAVSRGALRSLSAPTSAAGLVIGHDRQYTPVPVRLFAPEPVRIALVGGVWAAHLLIFRAFAVGARITVVTAEPAAWIGFGERATGQDHRLTVLSGGEAPPQGAVRPGSAQQPVLAVYDLRVNGPATAPPLGPWRSQLTILRHLDRPGIPVLQDAQLTLLQRLGGAEAALAASALRLRRHSEQFLQFMADDMMALVCNGTDRYLSLAQTRVEQEHVGLPRR